MIFILSFLNKYFIISTIIIWVLFRLRSRLHCHFSGMISHILYALRVHGRWTSNIYRHHCIRCTHHRSACTMQMSAENEWMNFPIFTITSCNYIIYFIIFFGIAQLKMSGITTTAPEDSHLGKQNGGEKICKFARWWCARPFQRKIFWSFMELK